MSLQFIFREISSADTDILHMIELRKANVEDYLCCEVTNEDGITNTTWYSKEDVALWGEDYIRANTTMEYSDFTGWIISLDLEPWNDMQEASKKKKQAPCFQAPSWLEGHIKEWKQKRLTTVTLCSTSGNERLEVWYYGDLLTINGEPQLYIVPSYFAPELVIARDPESNEEIIIFDGGRDGYGNMFCDEHDLDELERRTLKRYEIPASKLILELGYSIDYEDEKEDFQVNEDGMVALINGERMSWEQVKKDGIDYIALYYVNEEGKQVQILDNELA